MKHLKPYKIFESSVTPEEFCNKYLPGNFGDYKIKIVNGEIHIDGDVNLYGKGLSKIPKFGSVTGFIDVRKNNLKTFEFLPEECGSKFGITYNIHMNPYEGELKRIVELTQNKNGDGTSGIYNMLFNNFIKKCLENGVWHDGKSNEFGIKDAWHDVKLDEYNENKNAFFFGKYRMLDLDDVEILEDQFNLDPNEDWILELVENLIEKLKSDDASDRKFYFLLLSSLIKSDIGDEKIKEVISGTYNLSEVYDRLDTIFNMSDISIQNVIDLIQKKLTRGEYEKNRDETHDLFVFIGRDKFVEKEDGSYRKSLEVENFLKVNIYNPEDLQMINMMKIRARTQAGGSEVYMIWMPKDIFEEEKDSYSEEDISDYIDAINQKKTRI